MKKIKLCLIGTGKMGLAYVKVIRGFKHKAILTDVIGRNIIKTKKFASQNKIENFHATFNDLKKIDAFIIAVSEENLFKVLKKVAEYNLPTLIEKPLGITINKAKKYINFYLEKIFSL